MYVIISHFASGMPLASSLSQSLLWALRQPLPLVFHMAKWPEIPRSVWKVVFVCCSRRALSHIGVVLMGWCPGIYTCVGICGRVMYRDLWSYLYLWLRSVPDLTQPLVYSTNLFMISFLSRTHNVFSVSLSPCILCGWPKPVSSRSAKQP